MTKDAFLQRSSSMCTYTLMFDGGDFLHATKKFLDVISSNFPKEGALYDAYCLLLLLLFRCAMTTDDGQTVRRFWLCAIARPDGTIGIVQPCSQWAQIRKKCYLPQQILKSLFFETFYPHDLS